MDSIDSSKVFDSKQCVELVQQYFTNSALPSLCQYIKIPNLSLTFDKEWNTNGLLQKAAQHIKKWVEEFGIQGLSTEVIKFEGLTPIIWTQIKGDVDETLFFYGHYDKQPHFVGWNQGLGPVTPVIKDDKLYGRGGADDGYSTYGTLIAIKVLQKLGIKIPRCVMITEGDEESGSGHIQEYIQKLKERIGNPTIFFCLDSGTIDYDRFWVTNSLRGVVCCKLKIEVLKEGVHSGEASGIIPSSFRILRQLLERIQDRNTGQINQIFQVDIPPFRYEEIYELAEIKKQQAIKQFPIKQGLKNVYSNVLTSIIANSWKAQLAVTGASGLPQPTIAGNVMLPYTQVKLSLRLPPTKNAKQAKQQLTKLLTENPPYNAKITAYDFIVLSGFNAPKNSDSLQKAMREASDTYYGQAKLSFGEGGTIPLMETLKSTWPKGQFLITGVLGPMSNAHGPNEFLHIPYVKKLICCIAHIIAKR